VNERFDVRAGGHAVGRAGGHAVGHAEARTAIAPAVIARRGISRAAIVVALGVAVGRAGAGSAGSGGDGHDVDGGDLLDARAPLDAAVALDAAGAVDPCPVAPPACPALPAGYRAGDGLRAIDRCAFPLAERDTWDVRRAIVDALPASVRRVSLATVAGDLNRAATRVAAADVPGNAPGVRVAFGWQSGDRDVAYWIPQGLTGSFDGHADGLVNGRKLLLASWYYDLAAEPDATVDKGVRIAIVDVTDPTAVRYRFALLVDPVVRDGRSDFAPVTVHSGGLAWYGDLLYVPDTARGLRVFDLSRIVEVATGADRLGYDPSTGTYLAHGYKYVIPQVDTYAAELTCAPRFSFVAVDRTSAPPSLVSGEYDATSIGGRLYRWPLDPVTGRLALTDRGRVLAGGAWFLGQTHVQGAAARGALTWLSSSAPAGGGGALYRTAIATPSTTLGWIDAPEDLAFDGGGDLLWSLSEAVGARYVVGVARTSID
jgi:hypothetical protein